MATKENKVDKISVNTLKEIIKAEKSDENTINYKVGDNQVNIMVKNCIDKDDKVRFVRDVSNGCFADDEYVPYYREELFKIAVLEYFTNIKTDTADTMLFDLVNNTNIYNQVVNEIPADTIDDLAILVDDVIEWYKQEILAVQKQKLDAATEDMAKALEQMGELIDALNAMTKSFEGVDPKEILKVYSKLADKDEDEIAKSVIKLNFDNKEITNVSDFLGDD
ncbi:MAG: hypothetical protein RR806_03125 [Oscillospiraceae bacterium]